GHVTEPTRTGKGGDFSGYKQDAKTFLHGAFLSRLTTTNFSGFSRASLSVATSVADACGPGAGRSRLRARLPGPRQQRQQIPPPRPGLQFATRKGEHRWARYF